METSLTWLGRLVAAPTGPDWTRLVVVYDPFLRKVLGRTGVPPADLDDVVQAVYVVVIEKVQGFEHRGPGAFRAWLRGILVNQVRKYFRTRHSHPAVDLDQLACDDTELSRQCDRDHDWHVVDQAKQAIKGEFSPKTWDAFFLQAVCGNKPAEAAAKLGMTKGAVVVAKSRVLQRLREVLRGLVE